MFRTLCLRDSTTERYVRQFYYAKRCSYLAVFLLGFMYNTCCAHTSEVTSMISLAFSIINPFSKRWKVIKCYAIKLTRNYAAAFDVYQTNQFLSFECAIRFKCSHAGVNLIVGLLGYSVELELYNVNHYIDNSAV